MRAVLLILTILFISYTAKADHCAGGEISYQWLHDSTYSVTVKFYRACSGIAEYSTVQLCYNNTCNALGGSIAMPKRATNLPDGSANGAEIATGCPGFPSTCKSPGSSIPGFQEWWYETEVTLPAKCNYWRFYVSINARNYSVNLATTGNLYLEATLDNLNAPTNSSPIFTVKPVPYVCINSPYSYNNGVVDIDGDSLYFEALQPQSQSGVCANPPGSGSLPFATGTPPLRLPNNPFQTNNTYVLNSANGNINFTPAVLGAQTITFRAKEYRNGKLIGSITRDIQVQVMNCSLSPLALDLPSPTFVHATYNNPNIDVCQNRPFSFCFDIKAAVKGTILVVNDNHGYSIPASSISYSNQNSDSIRGCFSWSPLPSDTTLKVLTITVKDSTCLPPGIAVSQTFTLPIHFNLKAAPPTFTAPVYRCLGQPAAPLTATGTSLLWYTSAIGGTGSSVAPTPSTTSLGSTIYYVSATPNGCESPRLPMEVIVAPVLDAKIIAPKDTLCQYEYLGLANYHTHIPGFSYGWSLDTGKIKSRDTTGSVIVNWNTTGVKKVVLTTSNGICKSHDSTYLFVKPTAVAAFDMKVTGCIGEEISLTPKQTLPATYHWTITEQTIDDTVYVQQYKFRWNSIGLKTVTLHIISDNGCSPPIDSQTIYINENPPAHIEVATGSRICLGDELTLSTVKGSDYVYGWGPGEYFINNNYYEATMKVERSTEVSVSVSNRWGCTSTDSIAVEAGLCCKIFMPDAFSPNGDGHNDTYHAVAIENHKIHTFIITNRWGQTVFTTNNSKDGWDGKFKYTPQPTDTYFYYVKYICDDGDTYEKKGNFTLLR